MTNNDLFVDYLLSLAYISFVNINPFETMSAENPNDRLVQLSPAECEEASAYYDSLADAAESDDGLRDSGGDDVSEFDDEPDEQPSDEPNDDMDGDAASALASAGYGTDEDYGGGTHDFESWGGDSDGSVGCD